MLMPLITLPNTTCFPSSQGVFSGDEELRPICVSASIGHGQPASPMVGYLEVLISKLLPIDRPSSCPIYPGE